MGFQSGGLNVRALHTNRYTWDFWRRINIWFCSCCIKKEIRIKKKVGWVYNTHTQMHCTCNRRIKQHLKSMYQTNTQSMYQQVLLGAFRPEGTGWCVRFDGKESWEVLEKLKNASLEKLKIDLGQDTIDGTLCVVEKKHIHVHIHW